MATPIKKTQHNKTSAKKATAKKQIANAVSEPANIVTEPANTISVDCSNLETATLLFAFHESSKAQYLIRMAQSGASNNPQAAAQRIAGLKSYYNSRLDAMHSLHTAVSTTTNKTKKIDVSINEALTIYYPENTNSAVPEGYTWPAAL